MAASFREFIVSSSLYKVEYMLPHVNLIKFAKEANFEGIQKKIAELKAPFIDILGLYYVNYVNETDAEYAEDIKNDDEYYIKANVANENSKIHRYFEKMNFDFSSLYNSNNVFISILNNPHLVLEQKQVLIRSLLRENGVYGNNLMMRKAFFSNYPLIDQLGAEFIFSICNKLDTNCGYRKNVWDFFIRFDDQTYIDRLLLFFDKKSIFDFINYLPSKFFKPSLNNNPDVAASFYLNYIRYNPSPYWRSLNDDEESIILDMIIKKANESSRMAILSALRRKGGGWYSFYLKCLNFPPFLREERRLDLSSSQEEVDVYIRHLPSTTDSVVEAVPAPVFAEKKSEEYKRLPDSSQEGYQNLFDSKWQYERGFAHLIVQLHEARVDDIPVESLMRDRQCVECIKDLSHWLNYLRSEKARLSYGDPHSGALIQKEIACGFDVLFVQYPEYRQIILDFLKYHFYHLSEEGRWRIMQVIASNRPYVDLIKVAREGDFEAIQNRIAALKPKNNPVLRYDFKEASLKAIVEPEEKNIFYSILNNSHLVVEQKQILIKSLLWEGGIYSDNSVMKLQLFSSPDFVDLFINQLGLDFLYLSGLPDIMKQSSYQWSMLCIFIQAKDKKHISLILPMLCEQRDNPQVFRDFFQYVIPIFPDLCDTFPDQVGYFYSLYCFRYHYLPGFLSPLQENRIQDVILKKTSEEIQIKALVRALDNAYNPIVGIDICKQFYLKWMVTSPAVPVFKQFCRALLNDHVPCLLSDNSSIYKKYLIEKFLLNVYFDTLKTSKDYAFLLVEYFQSMVPEAYLNNFLSRLNFNSEKEVKEVKIVSVVSPVKEAKSAVSRPVVEEVKRIPCLTEKEIKKKLEDISGEIGKSSVSSIFAINRLKQLDHWDIKKQDYVFSIIKNLISSHQVKQCCDFIKTWISTNCLSSKAAMDFYHYLSVLNLPELREFDTYICKLIKNQILTLDLNKRVVTSDSKEEAMLVTITHTEEELAFLGQRRSSMWQFFTQNFDSTSKDILDKIMKNKWDEAKPMLFKAQKKNDEAFEERLKKNASSSSNPVMNSGSDAIICDGSSLRPHEGA